MFQVTASSPTTHPVSGRPSNGKLRTPQLQEKHPKKVVHGDLIHPGFNRFCKLVNGYGEGEEQDPAKHNYFSLRDLTKSVWHIYPILQLVGLVNERVEKLARAWYGTCWSIVYSCYRPWKANCEKLAEKDKNGNHVQISNLLKKTYNVNEHFRAIMGTAVSAIYGSGALGMLFSWFKGDDDLFDKSAEIYKTGMFNQNQIFASMNAATVMQREANPDQLKEVDSDKHNMKAKIELIDTALFIPNILTRSLDTLKMFGLNLMTDGMERFVNFLSYFSYGTWAARFGIMKSNEKDGGDLEHEKNFSKEHPILYNTQKHGGQVFYTLLPALSWLAAGAELIGMRDIAEKTFKLEGICERLNPTIAAWCLTNPWLRGYFKAISPPKLGIGSMSET